MRTCKDCLAYKIHHNLSEPDICPECHEKTLHWKQNEFGTFSLACSNCSETIAVDLNTPCEEATVFHQTHQIAISPSSAMPDKRKLIEMARLFHVNSAEIYRMFKQGFTIDVRVEKLQEVISFLTDEGIAYRLPPGFIDPRELFFYYKQCHYPYSAMRIYLR